MKSLWIRTALICSMVDLAAAAQTGKSTFPETVFAAKTAAIVNDTHTPGVEKGAADALQAWGQFKVVDDPQLADVTIRFEKNRQREGHDSQTPDPNGKDTSYSYTMSFSSSIHMTVSLKDGDKPFYSTTTEDSKAKAGSTCINSFHTAFREARQQQKP
jgi:hypothetical protein